MSRPMWLPPRFSRMYLLDMVTTFATLVGGLFVSLVLLGFISP